MNMEEVVAMVRLVQPKGCQLEGCRRSSIVCRKSDWTCRE